MSVDLSFYKGKKVLVTGHTGFKGSWLCHWLVKLGAEVIGYSIDLPTTPGHFQTSGVQDIVKDIRGDLCDYEFLNSTIEEEQPDFIFHLAAQALVRLSYDEPRRTFEVNIMGTINVLEAARQVPSVKNVIVITSDKVYENHAWEWGYRENDRLGGKDPYAASKACADLATAVYQASAFQKHASPARDLAISTVRAGNVIGGGDWALDRLVPDAVRAIIAKEDIVIRSPRATRPWQHVLEALYGYLILGVCMSKSKGDFSGAWNFGPLDVEMVPVKQIVEVILERWNTGTTNLVIEEENTGKEAVVLRVDSSKAIQKLGWMPVLSVPQALDLSIDWYRAYYENNTDMAQVTSEQIDHYFFMANKD